MVYAAIFEVGSDVEIPQEAVVSAAGAAINDNDLTLGCADRDDTTTLDSILFKSIEENGRTYHRYCAGKYLLPDDETEQTRLECQYYIWGLTLGRQYCTPLKLGVQEILDIGTGIGMWAIDVADDLPSAHVLGVDLSPIQLNEVPPNLEFILDDLEKDWVGRQNLDFVFCRELCFCFKDPQFVLNSAFEALKPGGCIELQDITLRFACDDDSINGSALEKWMNQIMEAAGKLGRNWDIVQQYKEMLGKAGFVGICEKKFCWPVGQWPAEKKLKKLGALVQMSLIDRRGIHAFSAKVLTEGMGMALPDMESFVKQVEQEIEAYTVHALIPVTVLCAQKPR